MTSEKNRPLPFGDLYIYYFEGEANTGDIETGKSFLGNWVEDGFSFLFFDRPAQEEVEELESAQEGIKLIDRYEMPYEQWLGERFARFSAGGFEIIPAWESNGLKSGFITDIIEIILDPGVVFGTGTHPTTYDCLVAVGEAYRKNGFETVLDLGTGTGVLAVAASLLGGGKAMAVDFNFLAAKTANLNVELNGLEERIAVIHGRAEDYIGWPADILLANIHFDVMKTIATPENLAGYKSFILSGLLRSEAVEIKKVLDTMSARVDHIWDAEGIWHTFLGSN